MRNASTSESVYDSARESIEVESPPLAFPPYGSASEGPTFLNYRNGDSSTAGGTSIDQSGAYTAGNQSVYSDPTSSIKHRNVGADPSRRRRSSSSAGENAGLTSNGVMGNQKTGHDAVEDMSRSQVKGWMDQPLVMAMMALIAIGMLYYGWVYLGQFNKDGRKSMIEII